MRYFNRTILLSHPNGDRSDYIPPRGWFSFDFEVPDRDQPVSHALRLVGEPDYFWKWRCEAGSPYSIAMAIDDALCTESTFRSTYALKFICRNEPYGRNAWIKLHRADLNPGARYRFAFAGRGEGLTYAAGGGIRAELEIYFRKPDRHPDDVFDPPDDVVGLSLPPGTFDWQEQTLDFTLPEEAVCVIVHLGLRGVAGTCWLGTPRLFPGEGDSIIPDFDRQQDREPAYRYVADNMSRRDWLEFECRIDGTPVFRGGKYSAIFRRPDFEIALGELAPGRHTVSLHFLNDYESAVGFVLQQLELLEYGNHEFEIIAAPEFVSGDEPCRVLIRTTRTGVELTAGTEKFHFDQPGLQVLRLALPRDGAETVRLRLESAGFADGFTVRRTAGGGDPILLSTGDAIYVPATPADMERFLEWYLGHRLGNAICFRHSYRWGGGRHPDRRIWERLVPLLRELNVPYHLMVDGRELPGMNSNPSDELLASPVYLGRQAHENDGSFCYWGNSLWGRSELPEPYADILSRGVDKGGIQPHVRPKRRGGRAWWFFDPTDAADMKEAAEAFVRNLADARGESTRHSGPSTLFRYFFQAGYRFLLAEQMYGPEEVVLAALRGASRAGGSGGFGAHLAAQWSSTPHDAPEHAERYFLSLATCYLQGVTQINLEEGLYRMEKDFAAHDRFSDCCRRHREAHTRFRRFLETHPRRGELVTPIACIQGRYDGWSCFCRDNVWRREGEQWRFGEAEESFDLLTVFYPRSRLESIYRCPCPAEPQGWYSGTPCGPVDLVPFEGDWGRYRALIFLGWHSFLPPDGERLLEFVRSGGTLLLTRRHFSATLKHDGAPEYRNDPALDELLGPDWRNASEKFRRRRIGAGEINVFMTDSYPAAIRADYSREMRRIADRISAEEAARGWIKGNADVNFAVYEENRRRKACLLNIRWWDRQTSAVIRQNAGTELALTVPFGEILEIDLPPA